MTKLTQNSNFKMIDEMSRIVKYYNRYDSSYNY